MPAIGTVPCMIWGVGTGRCGTRSLATLLRGRHEPGCWDSQPVAYQHAGEHQDWLRGKLQERLGLGVPAVVDLQHSYVVPLIEEIDPDATFIWMVREPVACISSLLSGGSWTRGDGHGRRKLSPAAGWSDVVTRLDKAIWYWLNVNQLLDRVLARRPHELWLTSELPGSVHLNRYPQYWKPTDQDTTRIESETGALWAELRASCAQRSRPLFREHIQHTTEE